MQADATRQVLLRLVMPSCFDEQRAGGNGDWIVIVGPDFMWDFINVYTRRKIVIP